MDIKRIKQLAGMEQLNETNGNKNKKKEYTVRIMATRDVTVLAASDEEAPEAVEDLYSRGDSAAELSHPTYQVRNVQQA